MWDLFTAAVLDAQSDMCEEAVKLAAAQPGDLPWDDVKRSCCGNCKFPIRGNRKLHTLVVGGLGPAFHAVDVVNREGAGLGCTDGRRGCC